MIEIIKEFPRLYTLDSKDKVRVFDCKVVKDTQQGELTGFDFVGYEIKTYTGILGGKLIEQKEKVKSGKNLGKKNETDPLAQALLQADSLWRAKTDEGYKNAAMIFSKAQYNFDPADVKEDYIDRTIKSLLPQIPEAAYTNSNWDELPMLAHPIKKVKKLQFPYLGQPKLNGVRALSKCQLMLDGHWNIPLISRGGTYYKVKHIQLQLGQLYELLKSNNINPHNILFDGELYKHGIPLQEISGAARKEEDGMFTSNNWLEYHIYDVIDLSKSNQTQEERWELMLKIKILVLNKFPNIKFVGDHIVGDNEQVKILHDKYVAEGYEGMILRDLNATYKFNERSIGLLKVKEFIDEEFKIVGYEVDPNKSIEESFVFILQNNDGNLLSRTFKARPTGTDKMKINWYTQMRNTDNLIGKYATVRYFERSSEGVPTMGHVRHKDTVCLLEHIRPDGE